MDPHPALLPAPPCQPCPGSRLGGFTSGFLLQAKDLPTFKDNDFLNEGQKLHVGEESKKNFLEKLKRDVEVACREGTALLCLLSLHPPCRAAAPSCRAAALSFLHQPGSC